MRSVFRPRVTFVAILSLGIGVIPASTGCGADGDDPNHADNPVPGYADPCQTPMGGAIGCPASPSTSPSSRPEDACAHLVSCGILATQHEVQTGSGSSRHWVHYLDYRWCVDRFRDPPDRRCSVGGSYGIGEVTAAVQCILATSCGALGAPLSQKDQSSSRRPETDSYFCADGTTKIWTATSCDHGILYYY